MRLHVVCLYAIHVAMKANEIRAELVLRNIKVGSIADELGIKYPSVSQVISRKKHTPYVREAIAKAIERPVEEVFPEQEQS